MRKDELLFSDKMLINFVDNAPEGKGEKTRGAKAEAMSAEGR